MTPSGIRRLGPAIGRRVSPRLARINAWLAQSAGGLSPKPCDAADFSSVVLLSVYRVRNTMTLEPHVSLVHERGGQVRLWCLDVEPSEKLAAWTVGTGPGSRCDLLNRAYACRSLDSRLDTDVVITDDDVEMTTGSIADLVTLARAAGLELAQPAHECRSHFTHPITVRRPLSVARETNFVEIGPMLFIGHSIREEVLPMPEQYGMGWGLDFRWSREFRDIKRMGVVDAVAMRHLGAVEGDYTLDAGSRKRAQRDHERAGAVTSGPAVATWRPWQAQPPWPVWEGT